MKALRKTEELMKLISLPLLVAYFINTVLILPNFEGSADYLKVTSVSFNIIILFNVVACLFYFEKNKILANTLSYVALPTAYLNVLVYVISDMKHIDVQISDVLFVIAQTFCMVLITIIVLNSINSNHQSVNKVHL